MKLKILRGLPGSGKSTLAKNLIKNTDGVICSADNYFWNGTQKLRDYNPENLALAHEQCWQAFADACKEKKALIVIDNCNVKIVHFQKYLDYAIEQGYETEVIVVTNDHRFNSLHMDRTTQKNVRARYTSQWEKFKGETLCRTTNLQ